ncbi:MULTISPECIES: DegT/DnrJ/EryC1/StrS family aminotransferase [Cyanophyceae]|uniref:DegT/DnrJ/EryC1/StrS family aminotransferase n=1 Tax=Cyanophyceae TaxID=3028117 RepID=UPI0016857D1E|nr:MULTISPECIES: DegT/DnrJ/EryC1/StrS family aminotransferase [Cyanophyceae]MBD1915653.1 DegT/DnrJ/EryC1/StrS family aminotransferase [Phormidium sp. FACHB-77]MBD2029287.1 DegT/DnrJ/EryC1/StrS family aminotransferase [Phormidium sp. FACHB-322]MBD2049277.1 DegT/DnrJ/EryC1/StrS family aminotransferase [Leptolyngbya sp. FACHB-60]
MPLTTTPQQIPILDLKPQYDSIRDEVHAAIDRVLESGQFIMGPEVKAFETEVADYLGVKHAIGVNSGTDALVIGLRAAGIGPGDEVITTPFSFFATAESISNVGAKPVFVDIDPTSFNLEPWQIEAAITPHTRAILPVHLFGRPAAMGQIMELAQKHGLKVVEDCAQSFGSRYWGDCAECNEDCSAATRDELRGKFTGAIGDVGAFSFFPSKNLGAYGDGGLVATNDDELAELVRMLRSHGSKRKYHNEVLGYNSRLDSIQAAILRVKLPHIDEWNQGRRRVAKTYNELLASVPEIVTPKLVEGHVFHQYTIRVLGRQRDRVHQALTTAGVGSMIYYPVPQDKLPVYRGLYGVNPVSDALTAEVLSLPIWPELGKQKVDRIVAALTQSLA